MLYDPFSKRLCLSFYTYYIYRHIHVGIIMLSYIPNLHIQQLKKRSLYLLKITPSTQIRSLVVSSLKFT